MKYEIQYGDILKLNDDVDAIVNSANPFMSRGGGICGKIHIAAGIEFTEYCIRQGGLTVGECKLTPGFKLPYKNVIHVLSPRYGRTEEPKKELVNAYHNVCKLAEDNNFKKIAFPLLSGDHHGYPPKFALECARAAFESYNSNTLEALLILKEV
jgi:O-acetyl-ADP-ribose deacetylase (regulator of RNase III)